MTILWLIALPLAAAVIVYLLRNAPIIAVPISAGTLMAMAAFFVMQEGADPLSVLGRTVSLSSLEIIGLAGCCLLLALMLLASYRVYQEPLAYPLTLVAMSCFAAATMVRNAAISALLLEGGIIASVMLIPSRREDSAMAAMRTLSILIFVGPLFLLSSWALESRAINPDAVVLARLGGVSLALGYALGLGVMPMHVWVPPVFRRGNPLAAAMLGVVLSITLLLRLSSNLSFSVWPGGQSFFANLMLIGGTITAVGGSLLALPQRSLSRALAYAAMADLGIALIGWGYGTRVTLGVAAVHVGYRALAVVTICMALGILRQLFGGDSVDDLQGAFRRAPLAVIGLIIAGLSLAGMPLTAGFSSRLVLYRILAGRYVGWAVLIMFASAGPAWAFIRTLVSAIVSRPAQGARREPLVPALIVLLSGLSLLVLGLFPSLVRGLVDL
ncbi:MAG: proton-conducting transporter transmembrane domain-containing protein [Anaerolineae bacterium]